MGASANLQKWFQLITDIQQRSVELVADTDPQHILRALNDHAKFLFKTLTKAIGVSFVRKIFNESLNRL